MKVYKITDSNFNTRNKTHWAEGVSRTTWAHEYGNYDIDICTDQCFHAYENPYIALLMYERNIDYCNVPLVLWEAKAEGEIVQDGWKKMGCTKLTTIRVMEFPKMTNEQRIKIMLLFTIKHMATLSTTIDIETFITWAKQWIDGVGRDYASVDKVRDSICYHHLTDSAIDVALRYCNAYDKAETASWGVRYFSGYVFEKCTNFGLPIEIMPIVKEVMGTEYVEYGKGE